MASAGGLACELTGTACLCVSPTPAPVLDLQACVAVWVLGYQIQALVIAEQRLLSIEPSLPIPKL